MKRKTVERTRNCNTMSESEFKSHIISALRQASRWWRPKNKVVARARVSVGKYKCELCGNIVPATLTPPPGKKRRIKGIQADHREPAVPLTGWESYDSFIERLFVEEEGWQAICYNCHSSKTKEENTERRLFSKKK